MSSLEINGQTVGSAPVVTPPPTVGTVPQIGIVEQGPPGPPGPTGGTGFTFNQMSALAVWTINHNLGRFPPVTIVNEEGDEVYGNVHYSSNNEVVVSFSAAFSGIAYLG